MKTVRKLLKIVIVMVVLIGAFTFYEYTQITQLVPQIKTYTFNGQTITFSSATIRYHLLGGLIPLDRTYVQDQLIKVNTDRIFNTFTVSEATQISITTPDQQIQTLTGSQELEFENDGEYLIEIEDTDPDGNQTHYVFTVVVDSVAEITISNLTPFQGELLVIELANIKRNSSISIESAFAPSVVTQQDHTARFYLPIQYRNAATTYPLNLVINDKTYAFTLDVKPFAFEKIYFTVDDDILNSPAGSPEAAAQFRNATYPLLDLVEPEEMHTGPFIIPVDGARISSGFGDMRYINGATTPGRHSGIDYAITCGTPVVASNSGLVQYADFLELTGNTVYIEHGLGLKTVYYHMLDLTIEAGDRVEKGQLIGHVGTTGFSTGCHLHFQAMIKAQPINPDFLYQLFK
jgi:murein DD-endopeptidase MepM/ murein hydrolase activator NlpD